MLTAQRICLVGSLGLSQLLFSRQDTNAAHRVRIVSSSKNSADYRWIDTDEQFALIVSELCQVERYALDTEFHRERSYYPHLALLQLAWDGDLVLVDPLAIDINPFKEVLESDAIAVMHAGSQDLEVLERACGLAPKNFFDTQVAAGFTGYSTPSLTSLVSGELGVRLGKGDRLTDWLRRPLGAAQRKYAAQDVEYLLEIHDRLLKALDSKERSSWAQGECDQLLARDRSPQEPKTAWKRIKEVKHLRGEARAIAKELAKWREETAAKSDQPVRFVLSDLALVGVAQTAPSSESELKSIRGLDGRHLRDGGASKILDAVVTGRNGGSHDAIDHEPKPVANLDRELRPAVTLISAWISQFGREKSLDPTLLATRADIEAFLRGDSDARLNFGWRSELLGVPIGDLVAGKASLAFDADKGLVLEPRFGQDSLQI